MYIYNYLHIWRAARYVKNPPANNYVPHRVNKHRLLEKVGRSFAKLNSTQRYSIQDRSDVNRSARFCATHVIMLCISRNESRVQFRHRD